MRAQLSFAAATGCIGGRSFCVSSETACDFRDPISWVYAGSLENEPERSRLGVTVSRRSGIAVVRNRVKRRVRECFRKELRAQLPAGTSMVVIARGGAGGLAAAAIGDELAMAARNLSGRIALAVAGRK